MHIHVNQTTFKSRNMIFSEAHEHLCYTFVYQRCQVELFEKCGLHRSLLSYLIFSSVRPIILPVPALISFFFFFFFFFTNNHMKMHCNLAMIMTVNLNANINQNNFAPVKFRLSGSISC